MDLLNVAQIWCGSKALGPGFRSIVWVQGCNHHCKGCISPEWIPQVDNWRISPKELAQLLIKDPDVTGLTFSGGEPMLQAKLLAELITICREERDIDVICFTGFTLEELLQQPSETGIPDFLNEIDVLIDGPYIEALDDNQGLRGSSNQIIQHFTDRLDQFNFETAARQVELHIEEESVMMIGIPPHDLLNILNHSFSNPNSEPQVDNPYIAEKLTWKEELNGLVGLVEVKHHLEVFESVVLDQKERRQKGLIVSNDQLPVLSHFFLGNPGTGKTMIARIMGEMYRDLGLLKSGHVVSVLGRDLISEYIGMTAEKVTDLCEKAYGGVLFIDDAHQLPSSMAGQEVINALLPMMMDNRDRLAVIFAGYAKPMQDFLNSYDTFRPIIPENNIIEFPDYEPEELLAILHTILEAKGLTTSRDFNGAIREVVTDLFMNRDTSCFGNARFMRNIADNIEQNRAFRRVGEKLPVDIPVCVDDIPAQFRPKHKGDTVQ